MKYYTETIPLTLAEKLKEKGMPIKIELEWYPNGMAKAEKDCHKPMTKYCEVFDWLMEKEIFISLPPIGKLEDGSYRYEATITYDDATNEEYFEGYTWHGVANAAIEKALTLI